MDVILKPICRIERVNMDNLTYVFLPKGLKSTYTTVIALHQYVSKVSSDILKPTLRSTLKAYKYLL